MSSRPIGIIANPSSGKDVRRIVSHASIVTNFEKINVLKRVLTGLAATGARWVVYMPDPKDLVGNAYHSLALNSGLKVNPVNIAMKGNELDTTAAADRMAKMGVACIVTLGGDGTNRLVAKQTTDIPLIPLSTGTNNIFPDFTEGTKAGFAAGILNTLSGDGVSVGDLCSRHKIMKIESDDWNDCALIDAAILSSKHVGGRALWQPDSLQHIFVTRSSPAAVGLSGIVGSVMEIGPEDPHGAHLAIGTKFMVKAILTSGVVADIGVESGRKMVAGEAHTFFVEEGTVMLDGEKILTVHKREVTLTLDCDGPLVLDVATVLSLARKRKLFFNNGAESDPK